MAAHNDLFKPMRGLYRFILNRKRRDPASQGSGAYASCAPELEQLERRLLLSADLGLDDPADSLFVPVAGIDADVLPHESGDGDILAMASSPPPGFSGAAGDVISVDLDLTLGWADYTVISGELGGSGWPVDLVTHAPTGDTLVKRGGVVLGRLIDAGRLGGDPFAESGHLYFAPSTVSDLVDDTDPANAGFQGEIVFTVETSSTGPAESAFRAGRASFRAGAISGSSQANVRASSPASN